MLIRLVSDLHLEHHYDTFDSAGVAAQNKTLELVPIMDNDADTTLVVGGDIATIRRVNRILNFLSLVCPRFKHVIYVLGNHEHYGVNMDESMQLLMAAIDLNLPNITNLHIAGNDPKKFVLDDITFLCGTLWTEYGAGHPDEYDVRRLISTFITDHKVITKSTGGHYRPEDMERIFRATISQFAFWLRETNPEKVVVCTHHMPSFQAVHPMYASGDRTTRLLNHAFASNLDDFIIRYKPAKWLFGHTHTQYRGMLGETELICNPGGYPKEGNLFRGAYDPFLRVEV